MEVLGGATSEWHSRDSLSTAEWFCPVCVFVPSTLSNAAMRLHADRHVVMSFQRNPASAEVNGKIPINLSGEK